jgi:multisubunit Na+/H+ antiporter MnhE subunit
MVRLLLWLLALFGLWMLFVTTTSLAEVLLGLGSALLALIGVAVLRRRAGRKDGPSLAWLAHSFVLVPRLFSDTAMVFAVLARQLARRDPVVGGFRAVPYSSGQTNAESATAADAFTLLANSLTPNTIALDIDPLEGVVLVHQLRLQSHEAAARELIRPA